PVGFVKLLVDGSTAQRTGKYPTLDYDMVTVSGQNNTLGLPIYLLPLNTDNRLCVTAISGGGTLTIPDAPGFSLTFGPGQVTFPGGSKEGCVSVTVVHGDKVPMVPGFGQQPRFIVTIQPAGAVFNPPAAITLPNVDGLRPRAVTEMYSFDHDIGSFVAIGTGTVSDDGQVIRSNPGVGVLKAGWHCGGDPAANGTVADCPECKICQGDQCVADPGQQGKQCANDVCKECQNGSCVQANLQLKITEPSNTPNPFSFLAQRSFANTATGDTITARATVTPARDLSTLEWSVTATQGGVRNETPPDRKGPTFSFIPDPPAHPPYARANGNSNKSTPFSYTSTATFCTKTDSVTITQDDRDIIRQEYVNHGLAVPARGDINAVVATAHFTVANLNNTAYSPLLLGNPGPLAEAVRAQYNSLINDDVQAIAVGTANLNPNAVVVSPGATIDTVGALLDTPRCNGAPNPATCDDVVVGNTITAGPNGIAETRAVNQTTNFGLTLSSGWRNPQRNEAVGGVLNSRHQFGNAIDLVLGPLPRK